MRRVEFGSLLLLRIYHFSRLISNGSFQDILHTGFQLRCKQSQKHAHLTGCVVYVCGGCACLVASLNSVVSIDVSIS